MSRIHWISLPFLFALGIALPLVYLSYVQRPAGFRPIALPDEEQNQVMAATQARDPNRLWCAEHSVYEDECVLCHPELAVQNGPRDPNRLWCAEHGVYEDECVLCHPELKEATASADLWCEEHGVAERECGICHPELIAGLAPGQGLKVRLASALSAEKAGVRTGHASMADSVPGISVLGQVTYNRNNLAAITPLLGGVLQAIHVDVGDTVALGTVLAEVAAPALASETGAYIKALAALELHRAAYRREEDLVARKIAARKDYEQAKAEYDASQTDVDLARQRLIDLGFTPEGVAEIGKTKTAVSTLSLRAPFAGTIIGRDAVLGAAVDTEATLFRIADLSSMWMELSVSEAHLAHLAVGIPITATFAPLPGESFQGVLTWIASSVDETTRMVEVRADLPNPGFRLRHAMFGSARIDGPEAGTAVSLPVDAVQHVDGRTVVFAKLEPTLFETRVVKLGGEENNRIAILQGVSPSDEVVVRESYILKSELLKARLGAGCVD